VLSFPLYRRVDELRAPAAPGPTLGIEYGKYLPTFSDNCAAADSRDDLSSRLMTLKYRWRSPLSVYGYAVKSMIDPLSCERMHNHYCWAATRDYESRGYIEVISEQVAVNQHYKPCHLNATECADALKRAHVDDVTMTRHRDKLVANVVRSIRNIFGLSTSDFLQRYYAPGKKGRG